MIVDVPLGPVPLCCLLPQALCYGPWNLQVSIFLTYSLVEDERKLPFPTSVANLSSTEKIIVTKRMCQVRGLGGGTCAHVELGVGLASSCSCGLRVGRLAGGKLGHYDQGWGSGLLGGKNRQTHKHNHFMTQMVMGKTTVFLRMNMEYAFGQFSGPKASHHIVQKRDLVLKNVKALKEFPCRAFSCVFKNSHIIGSRVG